IDNAEHQDAKTNDFFNDIGSKQLFATLGLNDCYADCATIRILTPKDRSLPKPDIRNNTLQFPRSGQSGR
ncbi:hypothetical protein, partial [Ruegeria lacuscaerulensis]|uniref:hypothetical protein n=1 Tax=Ruegeria lacuscaerulensis TaxID=55218 RepID=UPI001BE4C7FF